MSDDRPHTPTQTRLDEVVTTWPDVRGKNAFGHRGYVHNGKMFGFLADEGVAIKVWAGDDAAAVYAQDGVHAFAHSGMEMRAWPVLPLRSEAELETALSALQNAYEKATQT